MINELIQKFLKNHESLGLSAAHFKVFEDQKIEFSTEHAILLGFLFEYQTHQILSFEEIMQKIATLNQNELASLILNYANEIDSTKFTAFCKKNRRFPQTEEDFIAVSLKDEKNRFSQNQSTLFASSLIKLAQTSKEIAIGLVARTPQLGEGQGPTETPTKARL